MDKERIGLEARLTAIEYLLTTLLASRYQQRPDPLEALDAAANGVRDLLNQATIPGVDPALSDHAAAETRDEVLRLMSATREILTSHQKL